MSAALPSSRADPNAAAIRSLPVTVASAIQLFETLESLGKVLVPTSAQAHEVISGSVTGAGQEPGDRVCRLERGQDPLQPRKRPEGAQGVGVGNRLVARPAAVAEV